MQSLYVSLAWQDIQRSLGNLRLAGFLAREDIKRRYVRTLFGPWWIVLSMGVWFAVVGFVMASLFRLPLQDYFPFVVSGLLMWTLIATSITESSHLLIYSASLIKSFPIPIFTHYLRFACRNLIVFMHSIILLVIVMMIYPPPLSAVTWLAIPGLFLNLLILMNIAVCLSLANLRFRDTHLAVASNLQILPFVTPIFWNRDMLQGHYWIADINPLYHMIDIVRAPLLGQAPQLLSWEVAAGFAAITLALALFSFVRFRHRIILWL